MAEKKKITDIKDTTNAERPPEPRWLFYVLSAIMPIAGVIIGVIFQSKPDEENRKFGKTCLYIAVGVIAAIILLYIAMIAIYVAIIVVYFIIIIIVVIFYVIVMIILIALGVIGGAAGYIPGAYALLDAFTPYLF